jgi:hypothetical protein
MLDIISITKDDPTGIARTLASTLPLRNRSGVRQFVLDGSCDSAQREVQTLCASQQDVRYVWSAPRGISCAFNEGIDLASARWLWFLNGGDEVHPNLDPDLLMSLLRLSTADMLIFKLEARGLLLEHPAIQDLWPPFVDWWVHHQAVILSRDLLVQVAGYRTDYKILMDSELWLRLFLRPTKADILSFPLGLVHEWGNSTSDNRLRFREQARMVLRHAVPLARQWGRIGYRTVRDVYRSARSGGFAL